MKPQTLTINGELFEEFRNNLDASMLILINRMISTKISKGTVSAKIGIELKEYANDDGEICRTPDITYSIGMSMSEKDSIKGNLQRGLYLRRAPTGRLLIGTDQISMDELIREGEA